MQTTQRERDYSPFKVTNQGDIQSSKYSTARKTSPDKNINYSTQNQFLNFQCNLQNHDNNPLNLVCIEPQCNQRGLICTHCMHFFHKNHKNVPLKIFIENYKFLTQDTQVRSEQMQDKIVDLLNLQNSVLKLYDEFLIKVTEQVEQCKQQIQQYFLQDIHPFHNLQISLAGCQETIQDIERRNYGVEQFQQSIQMLAQHAYPSPKQEFQLEYFPSDLPYILVQTIQKSEKTHDLLNYNLQQIFQQTASQLSSSSTIANQSQIKNQSMAQQQPLSISRNFQVTNSPQRTDQPSIFKVKLKQKIPFHEYTIRDIIQVDQYRLATCSYDKTIKIMEIQSKKQLQTLQGHQDEVYQLNYSKKHLLLGSSSYDQTIILWREGPSGFSIDKILKGKITNKIFILGHTGKTWSIEFLDSIDKVATGGKNQTIIIWDIFTGAKDFIIKGSQEDTIWCLYAMSNGNTLISADNQKLKLWDIKTMKLQQTVIAHTNRIYTIIENQGNIIFFKQQILQENQLILSGSMDQTVKIWDSNKFTLVKLIQEVSSITSMVFLREYNLLIIGMMDDQLKGKINIYSSEDFEKERELQIFNQTAGVTKLIWWGDSIVSSHADGLICFTQMTRK